MASKKCVVNYHVFTIFLVAFSANFGINSAVRTLLAEELCYGSGYGSMSLKLQKSVILASVPTAEQSYCRILVQTERPSYLVVAFNRYHMYGNDSLTFTDRHNFKLSLTGEGYYVDERKSIILEGPVNIHYYTHHVQPDTKLKFQIVLTQVHDAPCWFDEYQCQNNKCIPKNLACDQHNHCGDLSFPDNCSPDGTIEEVRTVSITKTTTSPFLITILVSAGILSVVIVVLIVGIVRICINRRKKAQQPALPTVAAAVEPPRPVQASVLNRIRQSFRGMRQPTAPPPPPDSVEQHSESCEVPSMYPKLPSDVSGVDNPDFRRDE